MHGGIILNATSSIKPSTLAVGSSGVKRASRRGLISNEMTSGLTGAGQIAPRNARAAAVGPAGQARFPALQGDL